MADLDKRALFDFLEVVDEALPEPVSLVAVGGTALTLMDVKPSTRDVDFTGPFQGVRAFRAVIKRLAPGFKVDTWSDGQVFAVTLPEDYLDRSTLVRAMARIQLRHLHPVDLVVTKLARYDERDQEDIAAVVRDRQVTAREVRARAARVGYAGNEDVFASHLRHLVGVMRRRPSVAHD